MADRMPCRALFLSGPFASDHVAIFGPPPDGQRCYAYAYEADGMTMDHYRPEKAARRRLAFLQMLEDRSLMEMPDG